jgi:hypothetical protein
VHVGPKCGDGVFVPELEAKAVFLTGFGSSPFVLRKERLSQFDIRFELVMRARVERALHEIEVRRSI